MLHLCDRNLHPKTVWSALDNPDQGSFGAIQCPVDWKPVTQSCLCERIL